MSLYECSRLINLPSYPLESSFPKVAGTVRYPVNRLVRLSAGSRSGRTMNSMRRTSSQQEVKAW